MKKRDPKAKRKSNEMKGEWTDSEWDNAMQRLQTNTDGVFAAHKKLVQSMRARLKIYRQTVTAIEQARAEIVGPLLEYGDFDLAAKFFKFFDDKRKSIRPWLEEMRKTGEDGQSHLEAWDDRMEAMIRGVEQNAIKQLSTVVQGAMKQRRDALRSRNVERSGNAAIRDKMLLAEAKQKLAGKKYDRQTDLAHAMLQWQATNIPTDLWHARERQMLRILNPLWKTRRK